MENVRNCRVVKLVAKEERRKKLVSEPNYDSCKQFSDSLMAIEMRKTEVLMDNPIAVGQAILDISKTLTYEFWYDYLNQSIKITLNCVTWILIDSYYKSKQIIFSMILIMMLINGLILLIMIKMIIDH